MVHMIDSDWKRKITRSIRKLETNSHNLTLKRFVVKGCKWLWSHPCIRIAYGGSFVPLDVPVAFCLQLFIYLFIFFLYHWEAPLVLYPCGPCVVMGQFLCFDFGTQKGFSQ